MSSPRAGLRIAAIVFAIFAIGHLVRLLTHTTVLLGTHQVPMGVSLVGLIVAAGLSLCMWKPLRASS